MSDKWGRPRMFLQVQSTSYHILNMFDIFNAYFKSCARTVDKKKNCV